MKRFFSTLFTTHNIVGLVMLGLAVLLFKQQPTPQLLQMLRNFSFDSYQRMQPRVPDPDKMVAQVAIVDIDDASLESVGQWPWPRTTLAQLVNKLTAAGALVIGFDVVFPEEDRLSPPKLAALTNLPDDIKARLAAMPSNEAVFAQAIKAGNVVLGQVNDHTLDDSESLPRKVSFNLKQLSRMEYSPDKLLDRMPGLLRNVPDLENASDGLGMISFKPDLDSIARELPLMFSVRDEIYPSLSLEMIRVAMGSNEDYMYAASDLGIDSVIVKGGGGFKIPTTQKGKVWIHFARYSTTDPIYISAKDIMEKSAKELFPRVGNKFVLVGTSAVGLRDIRSTPLSSDTPGVEVHAQMLENILSRTHLKRNIFVIWIEFSILVLGGLLLIILVPRLNALWNFLLSVAIVGGLAWTAWHFYTTEQELIDVAYPSLVILTMFITLSYLNYMREEKERRQVKTAFSHYVSPALLDELADDPSKLKLGGEIRNITILFSDIRGFTTISEQFDAEGLTAFINSFLTPMTNVIMERKGTIDKYMGDAIMAFWNAPLPVPDHPVLACEGALVMQTAVADLNEKLEEEAQESGRKHIPIHIGVGINTGDCCVGNMGSDQRFDYSALGDPVNLAARLEGQSKTYGVDVVISEYTLADLPEGRFAIVELDLIQVKGKTEPVHIYALLGDQKTYDDPSFQEMRGLNALMITTYRSQQFGKALEIIQQCRSLWPSLETLYQLYEERIADYQQTPPAKDWDGVFIATSK